VNSLLPNFGKKVSPQEKEIASEMPLCQYCDAILKDLTDSFTATFGALF